MNHESQLNPGGGAPTSINRWVYNLFRLTDFMVYLALLIPSHVMRFTLEYKSLARLLHN